MEKSNIPEAVQGTDIINRYMNKITRFENDRGSLLFDSSNDIAPKIAVVIPCFKVRNHILSVIGKIGREVEVIFVVDDCCPDHSGEFVQINCSDPRVVVMTNQENLGVGGAVMRGYQAAIDAGVDVIVKVDGDGQMDPDLIPAFVAPIVAGDADYTKGNRFFNLDEIAAMPKTRLFGNAALSFMSKLSTGYWDLFDPTNGYTAIHADVCKQLPLEKISQRYFFETDMLFRLNTLRAVVLDVPMNAEYGDEVSNLKISKIVGEFFVKHVRNSVKRIFYNYYLRDMSLASIELPLGSLLLLSGAAYGIYNWLKSSSEGVTTPAGTVMLAALPILTGLQLLLAFVGHDVAAIPRKPLHSLRRTVIKKNKRLNFDEVGQ
jgi:dolichol-phosphate mannosyltransferase